MCCCVRLLSSMFVIVVQNDADRISRDRLKKLEAILSGDATIALHLQFLIRTNKADLQILKNTKVCTFTRSSFVQIKPTFRYSKTPRCVRSHVPRSYKYSRPSDTQKHQGVYVHTFLIRTNTADLQILKNTKVCTFTRSSDKSLACFQ